MFFDKFDVCRFVFDQQDSNGRGLHLAFSGVFTLERVSTSGSSDVASRDGDTQIWLERSAAVGRSQRIAQFVQGLPLLAGLRGQHPPR